MGVDILGAPAHVLLLEATDISAGLGVHLSRCSREGLTIWGRSRRANGDSGLKTRLLVRQTRSTGGRAFRITSQASHYIGVGTEIRLLPLFRRSIMKVLRGGPTTRRAARFSM
jgi:hypothetical protein